MKSFLFAVTLCLFVGSLTAEDTCGIAKNSQDFRAKENPPALRRSLCTTQFGAQNAIMAQIKATMARPGLTIAQMTALTTILTKLNDDAVITNTEITQANLDARL